MPDAPTQSPLAMAEAQKLITPEDAAYIGQVAQSKGVDPATLGGDARTLRDAMRQQSSEDYWKIIAQQPDLAKALANGNRAAIVQDQLGFIIDWNSVSKAAPYMETVGVWGHAGMAIAQTGRKLATGAAALGSLADPRNLAAVGGLITGDAEAITGTSFGRIVDAAADWDEEQRAYAADAAFRHAYTGGTKMQSVIGSVVGQAPEMLMTGFGAGVLAKTAVRGLSGTLLSVAQTAPRLTSAQIKAAVAGTSFIQGGMEAAQVTVDRMQENADRGRTLITGSDVLVAAATMGIVMATEAFGGVGAELRPFVGSRASRAWRDAGRDLLVQPSQEAVQEFVQSVVQDVADYKHVNWTEAGWSTFAGAIGGAAFAMPQVGRAIIAGRGTPEADARMQVLQTAQELVETASVKANVEKVENQRLVLSQMEAAKRMTLPEYRAFLRETSGDTSEQVFDLGDFAKIAEAKGMEAEALAQVWGGKVENGSVTVPTVNLAAELANEKSDFIGQVYEAMRSEPGKQSLRDIQERLPDLQKRLDEIQERMKSPKLPDGTTDDSQEVAKDIEQSILSAGKTKITEPQARATAAIQATIVREAAIRWNNAYAASGKTERVTPAQVWAKHKAQIERGDTAPAESAIVDQPDRGQYEPLSKIIRLGAKADVSTINHELMHHWIETTRAWAADPNAPQQFRDDLEALGAWADKNAASVVKHAEKSGITVDADAVRKAASDMVGLNINSKGGRAIHEAITGAYEEYLARGKAPTDALRGVFARMAKYFTRIYERMVGMNSTGVPLLNDEVAAVFDRMLRSLDRANAGGTKELTAETLNLPPDAFAVIEAANTDALVSGAARIQESLRKSVQASDAQMRADLMTKIEAEVAGERVYMARAKIEAGKLNEEAVRLLLRNDPETLAKVAPMLTAKGADPAVVSADSGYDSPLEMLQAVANAPSRTDEVLRRVNDVMESETATEDERIADLMETAEVRARIALTEWRAIRDGVQAAKSGMTAGKEMEQAAAQKRTKEEIDAIKAEWKAKAKAIAQQAKMAKVAWATDSARLLSQMRENYDAQVRAGAEYRDQTDPQTPGQLEQAILNATQKMTKLATGGDFEAALTQYLEVETLTAQFRLTSERNVDQVKAAARAGKQMTLATIRSQVGIDLASLAALAERRVAAMPAVDLKAGRAAALASAARRRKERAIADQNPQKIMDESYHEAAAEAMEAAVLRAIAQRKRIGIKLKSLLRKENLTVLAESGLPTLRGPAGEQEFASWEAAANAWARQGYEHGGRSLTAGDDLVNVANSLRIAIQDRDALKARTDLVAMMEGSKAGGNMLFPSIRSMAEADRLNPDKWTMMEWEAVERQMLYVQKQAETRPLYADEHDKLAEAIRAELPKDAKPDKQRKDMSYVGQTFFDPTMWSMANFATHVQRMGKSALVLVKGARDAELSMTDMLKDAQAIIAPARDAFTRAEAKALRQTVTSHGIQTNGWERISRLMMWGTESGRQRVLDDLRLRFEEARQEDRSVEFMNDVLSSATPKEIALVEAMWKANDMIWGHLEAAARRNGVPSAGKLEPVAFEVLVNGKPVRMTGGFAAVPYAVDDFGLDLLDENGKFQHAGVDHSSLKERKRVVKDRLLNLTIEAQHASLLKHIRAAAYTDYAKRVSSLTSDTALMGSLTAKFGEDYAKDLKDFIRKKTNPERQPNKLDVIAAGIRRAFTFAIYGFNSLTAIKQPLGVVNASGHPLVGERAMMEAIKDFSANPRQFGRAMAQKSRLLRLRTHSGQDVDYRSPEAALRSDNIREKVEKAGTYQMRLMQWPADVTTWTAAYRVQLSKNMAAGMEAEKAELSAIEVADNVLVETQGSSWRADQANISDSEMGRLLTFSGKWMINNANTMYRLWREARMTGTRESYLAFTKAVFYSIVLGSSVMVVANALLRPEDDDEKQRDFGDYAAVATVDMATNLHWVIRSVMPVAISVFTGNPQDAMRGSGGVVATYFKDYGYLAAMFAKDDVELSKALKAAVGAGSLWFPIPTVQTKRLIEAAGGDPNDPFEMIAAAIFGYDKTPIRK